MARERPSVGDRQQRAERVLVDELPQRAVVRLLEVLRDIHGRPLLSVRLRARSSRLRAGATLTRAIIACASSLTAAERFGMIPTPEPTEEAVMNKLAIAAAALLVRRAARAARLRRLDDGGARARARGGDRCEPHRRRRGHVVRPRLVPQHARRIELRFVPDNVAQLADVAAGLGAVRHAADRRRLRPRPDRSARRRALRLVEDGRAPRHRGAGRHRAAADARRAVPVRVPRPHELLRRARASTPTHRRSMLPIDEALLTFSGATLAGTFARAPARRQRAASARWSSRRRRARSPCAACTRARTTSCAPSTCCPAQTSFVDREHLASATRRKARHRCSTPRISRSSSDVALDRSGRVARDARQLRRRLRARRGERDHGGRNRR